MAKQDKNFDKRKYYHTFMIVSLITVGVATICLVVNYYAHVWGKGALEHRFAEDQLSDVSFKVKVNGAGKMHSGYGDKMISSGQVVDVD